MIDLQKNKDLQELEMLDNESKEKLFTALSVLESESQETLNYCVEKQDYKKTQYIQQGKLQAFDFLKMLLKGE